MLPKSSRNLRMRATWHHDFSTPEYEVYPEAQPKKWEAVRGLGTSFGNNATETDDDMLSPAEIVHLLVDIVSKNGNLMLGIAPDVNGTFREEQRSRLVALGEWLAQNGEAVYDTRPWDRAEGTTSDGLPVRFTCTDAALYITVLGTPKGPMLGIDGLHWPEGASMRLLAVDQPLAYEQQDTRLAIRIPASLPERPAWSIKLPRA
jgi:alpha-L-fucosidase